MKKIVRIFLLVAASSTPEYTPPLRSKPFFGFVLQNTYTIHWLTFLKLQ